MSAPAISGAQPGGEPDELSLAATDSRPPEFGRANLAPWVIASREFHDHPRALHIVGVRHQNRALFELLSRISSSDERGRWFDAYMNEKFCLDEWPQETPRAGRSLRNSYLRFLRGWGFDSNGVEGAVIKGWVESRLGLPPLYHGGPIEPGRRSYLGFALDRMRGHARTNAIDGQLDLLFEFCQYELARRSLRRHVLYRGIHDFEQHVPLSRRGGSEYLVRLNNVCSFSKNVERAWEFGNRVIRVDVPAQRILFFSGLLPRSILRGEDEYLVLGGEHWARDVRC